MATTTTKFKKGDRVLTRKMISRTVIAGFVETVDERSAWHYGIKTDEGTFIWRSEPEVIAEPKKKDGAIITAIVVGLLLVIIYFCLAYLAHSQQ